MEKPMAQRSAHFTRPGESPDQPSESPPPVFATSVFDFAGIRFPKGGRK
jgi:hypothetical protein